MSEPMLPTGPGESLPDDDDAAAKTRKSAPRHAGDEKDDEKA